MSYFDWLLYRPASMESYIRHTHSLNLAMNDQQRLQFSKVWFKTVLTHCNENSIYVFPEKEIARPHSQFPHSCVCERLTYSQNRSTYFTAAE